MREAGQLRLFRRREQDTYEAWPEHSGKEPIYEKNAIPHPRPGVMPGAGDRRFCNGRPANSIHQQKPAGLHHMGLPRQILSVRKSKRRSDPGGADRRRLELLLCGREIAVHPEQAGDHRGGLQQCLCPPVQPHCPHGAVHLGRLLRRKGLQLPDFRPGQRGGERQQGSHPDSQIL